MQTLHPRRSPERSKEAEPGQIHRHRSLRRLFERSKARGERQAARPLAVPEIRQIDAFETVQADREPVKSTPSKAVKTGSYANGLALAATISSVSMRPDLTWRAKALALALASHYPTVRPTIERLKLLTGMRSDRTVTQGLAELRQAKLLRWTHGDYHRANRYTLRWLGEQKAKVAKKRSAQVL